MQNQDPAFLHECIREIQDAMQNNRLAVFVGSGVSIDSGLPSWSGIIEAFARGLYGDNWRMKFKGSLEDHLKIPQNYFLRYGEVSYLKLFHSFFTGAKYKPNQIHKAIFDLKPEYIITTNYDSLLEQTAELIGKPYHVVSDNQGFAMTQFRRLIVKMHGDIAKNNMVLKEEDYLSYSHKFSLVENFVKSAFTTHTVLFIGYSANDPDFKLLLQSLKEVFESNMPMSYMIRLGEFDPIEFEYRKAQGIKVLYYDDAMKAGAQVQPKGDDFQKVESSRSRQTLDFLQYLNSYKDGQTFFDEVYELLLPLDKFAVIPPSEIAQTISPKKLRVHNGILSVNDKHIISILRPYFTNRKYYQNLSSATQEKIRYIRSILTKAEIINVYLDNGAQFVLAKRYRKQRFEDTVSPQTLQMFTFDYAGLSESIEKDYPAKFVPGYEQQMFAKAFFLHKLGRAKEANEILRDMVNVAFSKRDYRLYFLAAFNKANVYGKLLTHILETPHDSKIKFPLWEQVEQEFNDESVRMEELEVELSQLPKNQQRSLRFLKRILNLEFINSYYSDALRSLERLYSEKQITEKGGIAFSNAMWDSYKLQRQLWHFINQNYLIADQFQETILISKSLLEGIWTWYATVYTEKHYSHPTFGKMLSYQVPERKKIWYEILYWTIEQFPPDELENLFEKLGIRSIEVDEESQEKLIQALENLIIAENRVPSNQIPYYPYIYSAILLLSLLHFNSNEAADRVLGILTRYLEQHSFLDTRLISKFLVRQHDSFHITFSSDSLEKLLQILLISISKYPIEGMDFLTILVGNACDILQQQNGVLQSLQAIESIQELVNNSTLATITRYLLAKNVLVPIHPILEINKKERNSSIVGSILSELSALPEQTSEFHKLFYAAVWGKAIEPETPQIQALIAIIKQELARIELIEDADDKKEQSELISGYAGQIAHLLLRGRIQHQDIKELLPLLQGRQPFFDYVTAPESFDFVNFDISWLLYFSPEQIDTLIQVEQHKSILREKILQILAIKPNRDGNQYLSIFKKYLL